MDLSDEYRLRFFDEHGFSRKQCPSCESWFWTQDPDTELCGDPPCTEYSFIGSPITDESFDLSEMRERFLAFHDAEGHERVRPQPTVARWRDDIYLNIASIANYQPHVTSGNVPPPANPLAVSQPCIRLNDVDSVGRSGRHLTMFEMMGHHCFNYPDGHEFIRQGKAGDPDDFYFKERTVNLCHGLLESLGVDTDTVTYKENPWAGGGNAGPAFEVLTHGLEVSTLVFMQYEADPEGPIEVKGDPYAEMPLTIVDTGYGLERFVWASQGTPTIYESVFPQTVDVLTEHAGVDPREDPATADILAEHAKLSCMLEVDTGAKLGHLREQVADRLNERGFDIGPEELAERLAPLERIYAIADHTRCLAFMLGDGIVPSNVRAGYLARLLIRKSLRLMDEVAIDVPLYDVIETHLDELREDYDHLWRARDSIQSMIETEADKFDRTLERGRRLVRRELEAKAGNGLSTDRLVELYDSHGMPPEIVADVAEEAGVAIDLPDDFYRRVNQRHADADAAEIETGPEPPDLPETDRLYYDEATTRDFNATVLWVGEDPVDEGYGVILDQTGFYPEGGGQPADEGFLFAREEAIPVEDVQEWDGLVVHQVPEEIKVGESVRGQVDWGRRQALTRNHTATHIIGAAARSVLGDHVWQSGAQKGTERSRLDITHYQRLTEEEIREIETLANLIVLEGRPVEKTWVDRVTAEQNHGFRLYQGGVPDEEDIRVVRISEFDVQACGGTHVGSTGELGLVKIFGTERVQDGVERIEYAAGLAALTQVQQREDLLHDAADAFEVPIEDLPSTANRFFDEWKHYKKEAEQLRGELASHRLAEQLAEAEAVAGVRLVATRVDLALDDVVSAAGDLVDEDDVVAIVGGVDDGKAGIAVATSSNVDVDASDVVNAGGQALGGGGGGSPNMARAGGPQAENTDEAIEAARERARELLET
ncbi:alanine--tRNA ligase [Thermoplasmatales archaeon SW_10_69_26]|nr:MAG: alanine--tRNA ligase [Thermoplasmatales archaeon SW_10_69_26]